MESQSSLSGVRTIFNFAGGKGAAELSFSRERVGKVVSERLPIAQKGDVRFAENGSLNFFRRKRRWARLAVYPIQPRYNFAVDL